MRIKIDLYVDNNLIFTDTQDADLSWVRHPQPSVFRRINLRSIDELSRILEKIGLRIVRHNEPDVDEFMYLSHFNPMTNDSLLRGIDIESLRREYNKKTDNSGPCES